MDNFIIPNWHPLLVHFTVALITISAVFFILSKIIKTKSDTFERVAKWTLWAGSGITVLTILAGFQAYNSVAHDDVAHKVMKVHRMWALITGAAILLVVIWSVRSKAVSNTMVAASLVLASLIGVTGYFGAELVYRHGLGVMRLPETSGEGHAHAEGAGSHDHGDSTVAESEVHDHTKGEGSDDSKIQSAPHEHAEGAEHGKPTVKPEAKSHDHTDGDHDHGDSHEASSASVDPAAISDALYAALKSGDVETVSMLLADDVLILEGGHAQTSKMEYMTGHMKSDMAFLPSIESKMLSREVGQSGDIAWVITHSSIAGTYKGKAIDGTTREFLLLKRTGTDWKIAVVQWGDK